MLADCKKWNLDFEGESEFSSGKPGIFEGLKNCYAGCIILRPNDRVMLSRTRNMNPEPPA